ncbi:DUF6894 family protein [Methylobacterium oxalidis]|uniref:DUF6894 family protein n=1 Tax=Methylobacterium oxalidis TaxID=944322 RepID=UPI003315DE1D
MARYFFDIHDGVFLQDEDGLELADLSAARAEARRAVTGLIGCCDDAKDAAHVRVDVRCESGQRLLAATLLLVVEDFQAASPP